MQRDGGPGGPGAGGNPTGGSFTGPAEALEIVGNFGYAYSGGIALNNETKTFLEFTTGNFLYVSNTQLTTKVADMASGKLVRLKMYLNDSQVIDMGPKIDERNSFADLDPILLIIPAYTQVKVEVETNDIQSIEFYISMTGRIYRG